MFDRLFEFLGKFGRFFLFWYVCHPYLGGIILRLGKHHRMVKVGWNWIWPFNIEEVVSGPITVETMNIGPQSLTTKDGKQVVISTVVTFRVDDPKEYFLGIAGKASVIEDSTYGVVSDNVLKRSWDELKEIDLANELTKDVRRYAKRYGVYVTQVQIADFTSTRSVRLMQSVVNTHVPMKET